MGIIIWVDVSTKNYSEILVKTHLAILIHTEIPMFADDFPISHHLSTCFPIVPQCLADDFAPTTIVITL